MPGNFQLSVDELVKECEGAQSLGIGGVMLFGIPEHKDETHRGLMPMTASCSRPCARSSARCPTCW